MKIIIDRHLCEGNALCMEIAPEIFEVGPDEKSRLAVAEPDASLGKKAVAAARRCPRQAITVEE